MPASDPTPAPATASIGIDRPLVDSLRRRANLPVAPAEGPWTACAAPANLLVLGPDGGVRGCEQAAGPGVPGLPGAAFLGQDLAALRARLAEGKLPTEPCGTCAGWLQDELLAPPLRDYGTLPCTPGERARIVVVRLPEDEALPAALTASLADLGAGVERFLIECRSLECPGLPEVLTALAATQPRPPLHLRLRQVGELASAKQQLATAGVQALELTVTTRDDRELANLRALVDALGATATVRFVFTPASWFWFEDVAVGCAAHGLPLEWRVLDRGGAVPLARLSIEDLTLVKNVVGSTWSRLGSAARPASLGERAFDQLAAELRRLLRRQAEATLRGVASPGPELLRLPKPEHPWTTDPTRKAWWLGNLYGHGHLPAVREWLLRVVQAPDGETATRRAAWLRVLVQRLASDQQVPELLELLRRLYGDAKAQKKLCEADAAFAAEFDLTRFGGPWAGRLGIAPQPPRRRPFAVGKAKQPKAKAAPADITVLVPSFRHGDYIEETLRSVLAQRYANFKLLVVDDRSPDDTVARAQAIQDPRLEVRVNEQNVGLGNSVLQALATIDTPFVALLNSDDLFHPERLGRCRDALLEHPEVNLVTSAISLVDHKGGQLTPANASLVLDGKLVFDWVHWFERVTPSPELPAEELFATLLERNFLVTSSNLVARTGWLREQAKALQSLKYCLDWQLFLEAALEGGLHHIHEPLIAYRLHATNTVWFREGRRWSYYLEVNRVAAEALRRYAARGGREDAEVVRVLEAIAGHLAVNRETDGFALFLNTVFDALRIDSLASSSPRVQELVQQLNTVAEDVRRARDQAAAPPRQSDEGRSRTQRLLGELAQEQAGIERDSRRWLQGYAESLESRLKDCWAGRDKLEQTVQGLRQAEAELDRTVQELRGRLQRSEADKARQQDVEAGVRQQLAAAEGRAATLRSDLEGVRGELAAVRDLRQLIDGELAATRAERDRLQAQLESTYGERQALFAQVQELAAGMVREQAALRAERETVGQLQRSRDELAAELNAELAAVRRQAETLASARDELATARDDLRQQHEELHRQHETLHLAHLDLTQARDDLHHDHQELLRERDDLREDRESLVRAAASLRLERDRQVSRGEDLERSLAAEHRALVTEQAAVAELAELRDRQVAALAALGMELQAVQRHRDGLQQERQALTDTLARERAQAKALGEAKDALDRRRIELRQEVTQLREELERLRASREFRSGNFLWNKMPLGYMSRRGKKWYRRLLDAKSRCAMWGSRLLGRSRKAEGTAVVTACWQWPIYSHTFVYQEMIGLTHLGLDVRLFHWDLGDTAQLHKAFGYLNDHRTLLQPIWENHLKDKEYFEKTRPGKLRSFLERIAKATGRKVEDLEKESIVLQGCTFARMAELAGATYLHSYFFYDQTFMAMQAAWLLDLPRGVSCYADHMLDDYPFKLVPLHVELCDVIVATSARIKRELSQMTSGKFDDKIIVKPNGVDGARFPPVQRQDRQPKDPFEVISISRIEPKKGLIHLVEAVAALKRKGHKVKAHIVGSKDPHSKGSLEYAAEFEQRIADLGVQDEVILHGMKRQEELPPILQRCRAFVAPYVEMGSGDKDGIPTAMLEGLASGLPVLTTDSGSILEVVTTEVEGIVVPQRDSAAFAKAWERLILDPSLEKRMAKAARARFDREFDIRVTEKRLHERVAKLVGARQKSGKAKKVAK